MVECVENCLGVNGIAQVRVQAHIPGNLPAPARSELMRTSATLVLVLSPAFFTSDWFTNPVLLDGIRAMVRERPDCVIVVEKSEASRNVAAEFDNHRRSVFWRSERGQPRTLGFPSVAAEQDKQTYFALVSDLATALAAHLRPFGRAVSRVQPAVNGPVDAPKIFLAEGTSDVEGRRLEVLRYLEQAGYDVFPRGRLPSNPQQFEAEVRRLIADCRLFVQLLGTFAEQPDRVPEVVYRQLEIAVNKQREILQWRDPTIDVMKLSDPRLQGVLLRDTVQTDSVPAFCNAVKVAASRAEAPPPGEQPSVFVDASRDDLPVLDQIFGRYRHIRWAWHQPKRTELKVLLRAVDGVVLYWGGEGSERTQTRYMLFQSHFKALKKSSKRLLIYDGPPEQKPQFQGAGTWPLVWGRDGSEPVEFRDFLKEISNA
jgi:predicted CoA-binding protein